MAQSSIKLINAKQAAKILCCEPDHAYKLARGGTLTRYYIGVRSYRFDKAEVTRFAESNLHPLPAY